MYRPILTLYSRVEHWMCGSICHGRCQLPPQFIHEFNSERK